MITKLIKRTIEETVDAQGETTEQTVALEVAVIDDDGNEVGRVFTNLWGGHFNINTGAMDVCAVAKGISELLINLKTISNDEGNE